MTTLTQNKNKNLEVLEALEDLNEGGNVKQGKELVFDPETGEFRAIKPNTSISPNSVTIDRIAQDGFAANQ